MFSSKSSLEHEEKSAVGVLLCNLGTPDAPTVTALRSYLKEFLWDLRVVELPRWKWWPILNGIILNTRPKRSAEAYQSVWTDEGSPLLRISKDQQQSVTQRLEDLGHHFNVELGMRYGNPSIRDGLRSLREKDCHQIIVLPLYPQYAGATTGSTFDAVADELKSWRRVPALRFIDTYHDDSAYIDALADSVRQHWQENEQGDKLLISFHGIPKRYFDQGDPYPCLCKKTARLLAEKLHLEEDQWKVCFQSRFGKEEWVQPYTDETLKQWGREKHGCVDVICPGFSADCLETLEEIAVENRDYFIAAGGKDLRYIPALNADNNHISALVSLIESNLSGWTKAGK
ncbi:MAG: ferrochelatase [Mariprofundaceae bacterium]